MTVYGFPGDEVVVVVTAWVVVLVAELGLEVMGDTHW